MQPSLWLDTIISVGSLKQRCLVSQVSAGPLPSAGIRNRPKRWKDPDLCSSSATRGWDGKWCFCGTMPVWFSSSSWDFLLLITKVTDSTGLRWRCFSQACCWQGCLTFDLTRGNRLLCWHGELLPQPESCSLLSLMFAQRKKAFECFVVVV